MNIALRIGDRTTGCLEAFFEAAVEVEAKRPVVGRVAPRSDNDVDRRVTEVGNRDLRRLETLPNGSQYRIN